MQHSRDEIIQVLTNEVVSWQSTIGDGLLKLEPIGLARHAIRHLEIVYLALALTAYATFRWGHFEDPAAIADKVSLEVLR